VKSGRKHQNKFRGGRGSCYGGKRKKKVAQKKKKRRAPGKKKGLGGGELKRLHLEKSRSKKMCGGDQTDMRNGWYDI